MAQVYRALSSAIYGETKDTLVMSTSVVAAYEEDDIRLEQTEKHPIDTASVDSVRERFGHLLRLLTDTIGQQKEVYGGLSVPVVFGVPSNFKGLDLTDTLRSAYADTLRRHPVPGEARRKEKVKKKKERGGGQPLPPKSLTDFMTGRKGFLGSPIIRQTKSPDEQTTNDEGDVWDLDKQVVEHLLRQSAAARTGGAGPGSPAEKYKYDLTFHPRLFRPIEHGIQSSLRSNDPVERLASRMSMLRPQRGMELQEQYDKAAAGDQQALEKLREMAREEARSLAMTYAARFQHHKGSLSRFVMLAPPIPPFTTRPEYNFLQWFDLRKVFGDEFTRLLGFQHPVCIKAPGDTPSPAFADVAATYAYQLMLLRQTGNQDTRSTVMITSREDRPQPQMDPETGAQ